MVLSQILALILRSANVRNLVFDRLAYLVAAGTRHRTDFGRQRSFDRQIRVTRLFVRHAGPIMLFSILAA